MTDLTTKTAQSLHAEWCRQMWEKGMHGPGTGCTYDDLQLSIVRANCNDKIGRCKMFHPDLVYWLNLPESRRQEYLATAKAVLPEIVGELLGECMKIAESCDVSEETIRTYLSRWDLIIRTSIVAEIHDLRARRLEELK